MPDAQARAELFEICMKGIALDTNVDIPQLCSLTEGYSGADIHIVCREAAMVPMRRMLTLIKPEEIVSLRAKGLFEVCNARIVCRAASHRLLFSLHFFSFLFSSHPLFPSVSSHLLRIFPFSVLTYSLARLR